MSSQVFGQSFVNDSNVADVVILKNESNHENKPDSEILNFRSLCEIVNDSQ